MTKVCVLGAGAVGTLFGGLMQVHDPGLEVLLLGRGGHVERIKNQGKLRVVAQGKTHEVPVRVAEHPSELEGCDLALLTVKSQHTEEMVRDTLPYLGSALVVSIQNGINQATLAQLLPVEQVLVGMTATNMAITEPGTVRLQLGGVTIVGSTAPQPPQARIAAALDLLRKSGLPIAYSTNIAGVQYNKIAINSVGYASVLSNSSFISECLLDRIWRNEVARPILQECLETFDAAGIRLENVPGASAIHRFRRLLNLLDRPLLGRGLAAVIRRVKRERIVYSVEQDLRRGRPTEIGYVNGEIVRLAQVHGRQAPLNAEVVHLVDQLEKQSPLQFFDQSTVIHRLSTARTHLKATGQPSNEIVQSQEESA